MSSSPPTYLDPVVASRIKTAWAAMPFDQRRRIARFVVTMKYGPARIGRPEPLRALMALSIANSNFDVVVQMHRDSLVLGVDASGHITGTDKYEQLDLGWAESIACWLETMHSHHPFNTAAQVIPIPDTIKIAIAGDWGTGDWRNGENPAPSTKVATQITALSPDLTIHLGDEYYAGTVDEEKYLFAVLWPAGKLGSFNLNSNHAMYSGAGPYFDVTLANPKFALQKGCSFFALENTNWVIIGLDSAYYSDPEGLYMDGSLKGNAPDFQSEFLLQQFKKNKKVLILTHHNGLSEDGGTPTDLWAQIFETGRPSYWYWGHAHFAAVYANAVKSRCCGHGGIPYGQASILENSNVTWYEKRSAEDPEISERVYNGFAVVELSDANIKETFYDENGGIAWSSGPSIGS